MVIKIFGERNTGTNLIASLVETNLAVRVDRGVVPYRLWTLLSRSERALDLWFRVTEPVNLGWKHRSVAALVASGKGFDNHFFLCVVKHPYAWVLSMFNRPHHQRVEATTLAAFLQETWITVGRERAAPSYPGVVALWNDKYRHYLDLVQRTRGMVVRYEDLLSDPERVVAEVGRAAGASRRGPFSPVTASTKGDARTFDAYRRYYLEERWREGLNEEILRCIDERLDATLAARLGYRLPNPPAPSTAAGG